MPELAKYKPFMAARRIKVIYLALREFRGWSREKASMLTAMSPKTIERIDKGKDPTKDQVKMMDKVYGCQGELIDYWLGRLKLSCQVLRKSFGRKEKSPVLAHRR
ncbi:MAG: helix-turn-helix transcriptional regulator [Veillonellales bacterium]